MTDGRTTKKNVRASAHFCNKNFFFFFSAVFLFSSAFTWGNLWIEIPQEDQGACYRDRNGVRGEDYAREADVRDDVEGSANDKDRFPERSNVRGHRHFASDRTIESPSTRYSTMLVPSCRTHFGPT